MKIILAHIIIATIGIWLATIFVPMVSVQVLPDSNFFGFHLTALWQIFLLLGITLGLLNYFVKPILNLITFPLRIITAGLTGLIISMVLIWITSAIFKEFSAPLWLPLLWTAIIISVINLLVFKFLLKTGR